MAFGCCACDNVDTHEEEFTTSSAKAGTKNDAPLPPGAGIQDSGGGDKGGPSAAGAAAAAPPAPAGAAGHAVAADAGAGKAPPPASAAQSQAPTAPEVLPEQAHLQELVRDFARSACQGIDCEVVDSVSWYVYPGQCVLDSFLRKLTFKASNHSYEKVVELASIEDIVTRETSDQSFPKMLERQLQAEQLERLLAIPYSSNNAESSLYLLASSGLDRDRFLMCMKVLRLFALKQAVVPAAQS